MSSIEISFIDDLVSQLPDPNEYNGTLLRKEFIYNNQYFELRFYVVFEYKGGDKFWLYNPFHVQNVTKNSSNFVK